MKTTTSYLIRIAQQYRAYVRQQAKAGTANPIHIVEGAAEPQYLGECGYHTTPSGKTIVRHPNAYKWPTVYHGSTLRVEVGRDWLAAHNIPTWTMSPTTKPEQLIKIGACGIEGQAGHALGMSAERVVEEIGLAALKSGIDISVLCPSQHKALEEARAATAA